MALNIYKPGQRRLNVFMIMTELMHASASSDLTRRSTTCLQSSCALCSYDCMNTYSALQACSLLLPFTEQLLCNL